MLFCVYLHVQLFKIAMVLSYYNSHNYNTYLVYSTQVGVFKIVLFNKMWHLKCKMSWKKTNIKARNCTHLFTPSTPRPCTPLLFNTSLHNSCERPWVLVNLLKYVFHTPDIGSSWLNLFPHISIWNFSAWWFLKIFTIFHL